MGGTISLDVANEMGVITYCLRVESGENMSVMISRLIKYKYALPNNRKWWEHVSLDGVANEMGIIMYCLKVESGGNMSDMIVLPMKYKYALPNNRKWREHVSRDHGAAHEMGLRTHWKSKVAGISQPWLCCSWNINTHFLKIENGGNMSESDLIAPRR